MNYDHIEDAMNTIADMEIIRNNSKQDDGVDKIAGVDWFKFNGKACDFMYVSGNSYIGFGIDTGHLKVCNRDGAMYYLYRQEATLYGFYKFLKIRWEGYTRKNGFRPVMVWMTKAAVIAIPGSAFDLNTLTEYMVRIKLSDAGYFKNMIIKYTNGA